ncbi:DUF3080 family protein [Alteromonas facilis]|uniref:DUF3080 family protein n=1 Tax=Alteromonas facilis TaxID=2048004 RepID=UPI0013DA5C1E|nr:DUF3080 family protein [Alteromonas facilis]
MLKQTYILLIALFVLTACSPSNALKDALEEYHSRLARVLDIEISQQPFTFEHSFPPKSTLYKEPASLSINVQEFMSLPDCQLSTLIAERNTAMGKTQLPSQRYIYEVNLLNTLRQCIDANSDSSDQGKLVEAFEHKRTTIHHSYANLLQTSSEIHQALTQSAEFIDLTENSGLVETLAALEFLLSINPEQQLSSSIESERLENHLHDLLKTRLPAKLWRSEQLIIAFFDFSTPLLKQQFDTISCRTSAEQNRASILRNVFFMFFAEQIQPIAGQINNSYYKLSPLLVRIADLSEIAPEWKNAIDEMLAQHDRYALAMREHITLWQELFKRCNLSPSKT